MNKRKLGSEQEEVAVEYLEEQGYRIIDRNFATRRGELDIVGWDGRYLAFVEVKYRRTLFAGDPFEAVDWHKRRQISHQAMVYLSMEHLPMDTPCRFDVVAIMPDSIRLIKNAFDLTM